MIAQSDRMRYHIDKVPSVGDPYVAEAKLQGACLWQDLSLVRCHCLMATFQNVICFEVIRLKWTEARSTVVFVD